MINYEKQILCKKLESFSYTVPSVILQKCWDPLGVDSSLPPHYRVGIPRRELFPLKPDAINKTTHEELN